MDTVALSLPFLHHLMCKLQQLGIGRNNKIQAKRERQAHDINNEYKKAVVHGSQTSSSGLDLSNYQVL
jgi:hypothetical protein